MTFRTKVIVGVTALLFSGAVFAADIPFFTKMTTNHPVVACNTFAQAYSNGIWYLGDGTFSSEDIDLPPEASYDPDATMVYKGMVDAGIKTMVNYVVEASKQGQEVGPEQIKEIAKVVNRELIGMCNSFAGDLDKVILTLPNINDDVKDFIHRIKVARDGQV